MNYRHIYHAGNFADVHKHLLLLMVMDYLQRKDKGLFVLDAFAGIGLYDLNSFEAKKTKEFEDGIARVMAQDAINDDIRFFQEKIKTYWNLKTYAGSPLLIADMLRPQDRLVANELHPDDVVSLRKILRDSQHCTVTEIDAYQSIRGSIPPAERRGIILIDPPFEKPDEFEMLKNQMDEWKTRWATGCFILWYPIKADTRNTITRLHMAAQELNMHRTWVSEIYRDKTKKAEGLIGAGMMIFNTPFGIPERMENVSTELLSLLGFANTGFIENAYIVEDAKSP